MKDDVKHLDFSKPDDCREFLRSFKIDGKQVTHFYLANGRQLTVDQMNDSEAIHYANEMYFAIGGKPEGGTVNTDIDRGLN